jgi:uncharacterized protein YecT (DUF1311 family)
MRHAKNNPMTKTILFILLFLSTITLKSQDRQSKESPIDIRLNECLQMDTIQSYADIKECYYIATEEWDKEMNEYYKLLISTLGEDEKNKLEESQKEWIIWRDSFFRVSYELELKLSSLSSTINVLKAKLEMIKKRAVDLQDYYKNETLKRVIIPYPTKME